MRKRHLIPLAALLSASCQRENDTAQLAPSPDATPTAASSSPANSFKMNERWELQSSDEGVALALMSAPDKTVMRLFCPAGNNQLMVNVPGFKPVASEERLSFGSGGEAVALVADSRGDRLRGGVSGEGKVPVNLRALISSTVSASYSAQKSGPHPVPYKAVAASFVNACRDAPVAVEKAPAIAKAGACMMQDDKRLSVKPIRAIGTEPFWGAQVEGRCVTYNHPDDQKGTRVWTRYTATPDGGVWAGSLGGRKFQLTTRAVPGCSDGMSDKIYPIAVELAVGGEQRKGCARPD